MRKGTIHIVLTALLLSIAISKSMAATDETGSNVTIVPPNNTLSTVGTTLPNAVGSPGETIAPEGTVAAQPSADLRVKDSTETEKKGSDATPPSQYRGRYFGGKFGINNSSASGAVGAPSASTLAYGLQGGYLQGGYNWDFYLVVVGVGAYIDWNNYAVHSNGIGYGSRAYGLDAKLGVPVGDWMPYAKLGYGHNKGSGDLNLSNVVQNKSNIAIGFEYNFVPRWSAVAEYKRNIFSNRDSSITINNKIFSFGFNYYFDIPLVKKEVELVPEAEIAIPEPVLAPEALPEAPPAP